MPEGAIDEAGGRVRRNKNEKGSIMASAAFRAGKATAEKTEAEKKEAERIKIFKERRTDEHALAMSALAEAKLAAGGKLSNDEMIGFIRARTNKPVPSAEKKGDKLEAKVKELKGKPYAIRLSIEPDGYTEWLKEQPSKDAPKAAQSKAAAKPKAAQKAAEATASTKAPTAEKEPSAEKA
eukprot:1353691-Prymnesium_polylepis.1